MERADIDRIYQWENDERIWAVSGTTEPFSREQIVQFVERHLAGGDLLRMGEVRLVIERCDRQEAVGAVDLFEYDPINRRAGVGILISDPAERGKGYASDAIRTLCRYGREVIGLHQLWCNVGAGNLPRLRLFRGAGFVEVGTKREWVWTPEGYHDEILFQKLL